MAGIPVPEAVVEFATAVRRGSIIDTLWKVGVLVLAISAAVALVTAFGVVGAAVGAVILSALIEEEVRALVLDVWNRNFEEVP